MAFPRDLITDLRSFRRHCDEPTGPAFGGPDDKLRDEAIHPSSAATRIASRSLSSGAHSRDPLARNDGADEAYFLPAISFAFCPNIFLRASSSKGSFSNLPIARPACTWGRARTSAYQRLAFA